VQLATEVAATASPRVGANSRRVITAPCWTVAAQCARGHMRPKGFVYQRWVPCGVSGGIQRVNADYGMD
jgi:hypothetical protein